MKNTTYDILKGTVQIGLPGLSSAYFALAEIWGWGGAEKVVGTIAVVTTLLGIILQVVYKQYYNSDSPYDGQIVATHDDQGNLNYSLELGVPPEDIENMSSVAFRVTDTPIFAEDVTDKIAPDHSEE